jgi:hypothetical protein
MKTNSLFSIVIITGFCLINSSLALANQINWQPIPGTKGTDESGKIVDFWYIGRNTITRKGDIVDFDVSVYKNYVRYSANCRTGKMSRIRMGYIKSGQILDNQPFSEPFFTANRIQRKALNYACAISKK